MKVVTGEQWSKNHAASERMLVDVRTPFEFASQKAEGAVNLPLDRFSQEELEKLAGGKSVGLICQSGSRAKQAMEKCRDTDLNVELIEGGTLAWTKSGLPTVYGKKVMSLERQVRIAAGFLVLSGVVLSKTVLPGAEFLSGFVGAGLIFAGITDTCGMGLLIAKMPWNTSSCCEDSSCSTGS